MYNDHKTAADRLARPYRALELSRGARIVLALLVLAAFIGAGHADGYALAHGLIH